jgi:hypothetical protein
MYGRPGERAQGRFASGASCNNYKSTCCFPESFHTDHEDGGPVVVVDTNEMLHHKRGGVVSDGNLEAARLVATTYHTCLSRDILGLLCAVGALN